MGSSDSESENECFESAEESLDEKEELEDVKKKSQKNLQSGEREVAEPTPDCESVDTKGKKEEKQRENNSLSFRKRPERVKRLPSKTPARSTSKSPTNEVIFKTDKIVPDVSFQDITSNLSKNINKSLSTLQQKSSNVKDLIFSSLPSSSNTERAGFSYDDKSAITTDECNISNTESEPPNINQPVNEVLETVTDENIENKEEPLVSLDCATEKTIDPVDRLSDIKKERKPPDIPIENSESKFQGDHSLLDDTAAKGDVCDIPEEKSENISASDDFAKEDNLKKENVLDEGKDSFKNSCEGNSEVIISHEVSPTEEIDKINSTNEIENKNQENNSFNDSKKIKPNGGEDNSNLEANLETTTNVNFVTADDNLTTNDLNGPSEKINEVKSENIVKELKMALKNIVGAEEVKTLNQDLSNSNDMETLKDELNEKGKISKADESSKDGWDDFDFSDNEPENAVTSESSNFLEEKEKIINSELKDKKSDIEIKSDTTQKDTPTEKSKESELGHKSVKENTKQTSNKYQVKQFTKPEPEAVGDDNWDWDDWDETGSQEKEEKQEVPASEKPKTKNAEEDEPSDVSKWSGWDTFGQKPQEKQGNWGLGSWGVDMLLNKATAVTQGISNVLEAGLGAPDPETLARMEKFEKEKWKEEKMEENETENEEYHEEVLKKNSLTNVNIFPVAAGLTSLVAGVTSKIVEHSKIQEIGSKVITGGLDTLETFGKKTMEVLQEGDPGLKNKRALLLGNNKPVLSQVLREAREKAERESKRAEEKELAKKCHFETLFDDFQGMVHLEALEMLSKQCDLKLEQIRSGMNSEEQEDLNGILEEIEQLCSLEECDMDLKSSMLDFKTVLQMAVEPLQNEISVKKIIQIYEEVSKWLQTAPEAGPSFSVINQKFVATLAELTSATVQQFHKSGELLSVKECRKTVEEVDALSRLTNVLCMEIKKICDKFISLSHKASSKGDDNVESFAKKATVVMENSTSYIRQAFDLLVPVIQLGAAV